MAGLNVGSAFATFSLKLDGVQKAAKEATQALGDIEKKTGKTLENVAKNTKNFSEKISRTADAFKSVGKVGAVVMGATTLGIKQTTDASNKLENALIGLSTVSRAFGQDIERSKQAAVDLASDGLMSVKDAAESLKNLIGAGFGLEEAIDLMKGFKDAAAFNRQGTLGFGEAIVGATQGIKNQNSILVDNAGITKNLSIILKEQGKSIADLQNVQSDASVRQALYNGLIKEMSVFSGDAERAAGTLAGKQAELKTSIFNATAAIGQALAPAVTALVEKLIPIINVIGDWVSKNPKLVATIVGVVTATGTLMTTLGMLGFAINGITTALLFLEANPIVLVISAVVALIAGLVLLYFNIDKVINGIMNWVKEHKALAIALGMTMAPIIVTMALIIALVKVVDLLVNHWDEVKSKTTEVWSAIEYVIINKLSSIKMIFFNTWSSIASFFTVSIPNFVKSVIVWISHLPNNIGWLLGIILGKCVRFLLDMFNLWKIKTKELINAIGVWISELPEKITISLNNTRDRLNNWMDRTKDLVKQKIPVILEQIDNYFRELPGRLGRSFSGAITAMNDWVTNMYKESSEKIPKFINYLANFFKGMHSFYFNVGKNILTGFWEGLKSKTGVIWGWVKDFVDGFKRGFTNAFKIKSPSLVMAEIGEQITAGLAVGMENRIDLVNSASDNLGVSAINITNNNNLASNLDAGILAERMAFQINNSR